jgi:pimeloyl-ACP methyl ester carboxylesterase/DNA-binding winged helix-turn-helix (wHTH) protein
MIHRFADVELDLSRREVRRSGEVCTLQPRPFAVLAYLVRHRDRVVSKQELLEQLWPDVTVTESSLQRAVSLARAAIADDGRCLRTVPKVGYRFVADVETTGTPAREAPLRPRFVRNGDVHLAYHVIGDGDTDIVVVPGWVFPMRAFFDHPRLAGWIRSVARLGRVILFDKRGTGLSDRVKTLPSMEQRMDDLRAVLDEVGSQRAILVGYSEGAPLSVLFVTRYPARTAGLLLAGAFARWASAPDYPDGWSPGRFADLRGYISRSWGAGETMRAIVASQADDPEVRAWAARAEQEGASPGAALELMEMNRQIDVRAILPDVAVPTVVLHHRHDAVIGVGNARYLATHIPGARLMEIDGADHLFLFEGADHFDEALRWLLRKG